jgi:hypothetical protein
VLIDRLLIRFICETVDTNIVIRRILFTDKISVLYDSVFRMTWQLRRDVSNTSNIKQALWLV